MGPTEPSPELAPRGPHSPAGGGSRPAPPPWNPLLGPRCPGGPRLSPLAPAGRPFSSCPRRARPVPDSPRAPRPPGLPGRPLTGAPLPYARSPERVSRTCETHKGRLPSASPSEAALFEMGSETPPWYARARMLYTSQKSRAVLLASLMGLAISMAPRSAGAVGNENGEPEAIGKGIVGGALLGAELTLTVEALVGVKPWWGYLIGGGLGAVAGGVGGYFVADAAGPEAPTAFLVSGLVLAVPTTIFVLSQTAYRPPGNEVLEARTLSPPQASYAGVPSLLETKATGKIGFGFPQVDVGEGRIETVPMSPGFRTIRAPQGTFVQVPLLNLRFN